MYIEVDLSRLADTTQIYMVKRRTVWQVVDPNTLLIFVSDGQCIITMDNEEYTLTKGSFFIVPAGHHYIRHPVGMEMCTLYYAHIRPTTEPALFDDREAYVKIAEIKTAFARKMLSDGDVTPNHTYLLKLHTDLSDKLNEIAGLYDAAIDYGLRSHADSTTQISLMMARILLIAAENALAEVNLSSLPERIDGGTIPERKLQKVFAYIRLHSKENIPLKELCAVSNFSRQHLIRIFHGEFGTTPKAYILTYRINCAKELFYRNHALSVKEVAYEMGFEDQHYFSRLFRRVTGQTPSEYKEHLRTFDPDKQ